MELVGEQEIPHLTALSGGVSSLIVLAKTARGLLCVKQALPRLKEPNQVGTLTETRRALDAAREAHWGTVVSARSGETEDVTVVHLGVGMGVGVAMTTALE